MALIKCKDCGHKISKKAKACPNCGAVKKRSIFRRLLKYSLIGLASLVGIGIVVETIKVSNMTPEEKIEYQAQREQRKADQEANRIAKAADKAEADEEAQAIAEAKATDKTKAEEEARAIAEAKVADIAKPDQTQDLLNQHVVEQKTNDKEKVQEPKQRTQLNAKRISRSDYGAKWPFTVEEGLLKCAPASVITFISNGVPYAVNGTATSRGFADIEPIWAYDTKLNQEIADAIKISLEEHMKSGQALRINIGDVLSAGLELCP